jgi:hypothetical protein
MPVRQASSHAGFGGGGGVVDATCGCLLWQPTTAAKASKVTASTDFEKPRFFDGFAENENVALLKVFKIFSPVSSSRIPHGFGGCSARRSTAEQSERTHSNGANL